MTEEEKKIRKQLTNRKYYEKKKDKQETMFNKSLYRDVMNELTRKCILPRHIYDFRMIHKEMLKNVFKKKIIKIYDRTEVISHSYKLYNIF